MLNISRIAALALSIVSLAMVFSPTAVGEKHTVPSDPLYLSKGSWGQEYDDQWALKRIGFSDAKLWQRTQGKKPVVVAVVDSGVDLTHPDLNGALWINEKEVPNNGVDDDNNGYVDDVLGWNFVNNTNNVQDNNGHGTLVSGIIAARQNTIGITGVNPNARIMPVKVSDISGASGSIKVAKGIVYAVDNGAQVINVSIGGHTLTRVEQHAVEYAKKHNVAIIVASGNEGTHTKDYSPAGLPGVITVASSGLQDERVRFSNWGPAVDLAAPGVDVVSLRAARTDFLIFERKDYQPGKAFVGADKRYYRTAGSSFSAPFVTGVASLILAEHPEYTAEMVKRMLLYSAKDIDSPGKDQFTGYGLLNAEAALNADPQFFVDAEIQQVKPLQKAEGMVLEIHGKATADHFKQAWLELGAGNNPTQWKRLQTPVASTETGLLMELPVSEVKGAPLWVLRLVTEHENGKRQEGRYSLKLQ